MQVQSMDTLGLTWELKTKNCSETMSIYMDTQGAFIKTKINYMQGTKFMETQDNGQGKARIA